MNSSHKNIDTELIKIRIYGWETKNLDFKERFDFSTKETKASFVKDFLAMANTKWWWRLLIGFDDNKECIWIDHDDLPKYEITRLHDIIKEYSDPMLIFDIHNEIFEKKNIVIIYINEFLKEPIICKKDCGSELHKWKIYHRTDWAKSQPVDNSEDMRKLINLSIEKSKEDMVQTLHRIISWWSIKKEILFEEEINNLLRCFNQKQTTRKPSFEIFLLPQKNIKLPIKNLEKLIRDSIISLPSGNYPTIIPNQQDISPIEGWKWLSLDFLPYSADSYELFHFWLNWFIWYKSTFLRDEITSKEISMVYFVRRLLEHVYFLKNIVKNDETVFDWWLKITLKLEWIKDFKLKDSGYRSRDFKSITDEFWVKDIVFDSKELLNDPDNILKNIIASVFYYFNFKWDYYEGIIPKLIDKAKQANQYQ